MGLSLQNIRDSLRITLGVDDIDYPDTIVDSWINKSYWELDAKFPFREKEDSGTFVTVAGTAIYTISDSDFESLTNLAVYDSIADESKNVDRTTIDWYNQNYSVNTDKQDIPSKYFRNEQKNIVLWPTPDDIYTLTYNFLKLLPDLVSGTQNPVFPRSWHEIIELGAEARGFKAIGDTKRMTDARNAQVAMIGSSVPIEGREEFDTHRAGIQVPDRVY